MHGRSFHTALHHSQVPWNPWWQRWTMLDARDNTNKGFLLLPKRSVANSTSCFFQASTISRQCSVMSATGTRSPQPPPTPTEDRHTHKHKHKLGKWSYISLALQLHHKQRDLLLCFWPEWGKSPLFAWLLGCWWQGGRKYTLCKCWMCSINLFHSAPPFPWTHVPTYSPLLECLDQMKDTVAVFSSVSLNNLLWFPELCKWIIWSMNHFAS